MDVMFEQTQGGCTRPISALTGFLASRLRNVFNNASTTSKFADYADQMRIVKAHPLSKDC